MRKNQDPVVKAHQFNQHVDDIRIVAKNATDRTRTIRAVFKCNFPSLVEKYKKVPHRNQINQTFWQDDLSEENDSTSS